MASVNPGEIIGRSLLEHVKVHESRQMFPRLYNTVIETSKSFKRSKGGSLKDLRLVEKWNDLVDQGVQGDYVRATELGARTRLLLGKKMMFKNEKGQFVQINADVGVHKEIAPFLKDYIESPTYSKAEQLNFVSKQAKLGFSFFHHGSLIAQDIATGLTRGDLRIIHHIREGNRLWERNDPVMRRLYRHGLEGKRSYEDINYGRLFTLPNAPKGINAAMKVLQWPGQKMARFLFDYVQPGLKTHFAYREYTKGLQKALKSGMTEDQWARKVVKAADAFFSGEDMRRAMLESWRMTASMYFSPGGRRVFQVGFLSPTWQREHLLAAGRIGESMTGMMRGPEAWIYRRYLAGALSLYVAANVANYVWTKKMDGEGRFIFQNPSEKFFHVRAPFNYPDGSPAYVRPLKSIFEIPEFGYDVVGSVFKGNDPFRKVSYKIAPWITATAKQFWNFDYYGQKYKPGNKSQWWKRPADWGADVLLPISFSQGQRAIQGKLPPAAIPVAAVGMPVSKEPKKKKTTRRRRPTRSR